MTTHNNTKIPTEEIFKLPILKTGIVSKWRGRNITLYQHPTDTNLCISVGTTFNESMCVISEETLQQWDATLKHGKMVYE